ncbi:YjbF family lipoprotein [Yoonia sp.]|uniref:YjbF family lipoprotein n=1 Tax=Yoonia sp. TaxID=2212373 RepID=UPI0039763852
MRRFILVASILGLTACGPLAENQPVVSALRGIVNAGSGHWQQQDDPREILTREQIDAAPSDLLLFVPVNDDVATTFARVSRNNDLMTWVSDEGDSLTLQDGITVATRGLGNDLMGADLAQVHSALVRGSGSAVRIHDYLDGEDKIVREKYACEIATLRSAVIEIFEIKHQTRIVSETCIGDVGSFRNLYWIDAAGMIWQSRQRVSARVGAVDIYVL